MKALLCGLALLTAEPSDVQLLARTMWGEARGEGVEGMRAVGHVVVNRGGNIAQTIRQPGQFYVTAVDPNRSRGLDRERWDQAQTLAASIIAGCDADPTNGANYFHEVSVQPSWAQRMERVARIGRHIFYRG